MKKLIMANDETVKNNFKVINETMLYNQEYVDNQNKLIELLENINYLTA